MTDKKISQLTAATTPLAGTEVLPIVQSAATVKVATDDLTVKNVRSNATSGILQIAGPGAGTTRTMTVPNANFTAARTDAAQSFTGDQTLSTGNLVVGTAGKGIDFSANSHAAGMTSELLTWYEEGTWTPGIAFGGGTTGIAYSNRVGYYTRIGNIVNVSCLIDLLTKGSSTGSATVTGLPFTIANNAAAYAAGSIRFQTITYVGQVTVLGLIGNTTIALEQVTEAGARTALTQTNFDNTSGLVIHLTYRTG